MPNEPTYSSLMVPIDVERGSAAHAKLAATIAARFDAVLIGVASVVPLESEILYNASLRNVVTASSAASKLTQLNQVKEQFFKNLSAFRSIEWRDSFDFPTASLLREARAADLVVIEREGKMPPLTWPLDISKFILQVGRPVLLTPHGLTELNATRVVVGWKDVREARRAVRDALPFLKQAETVILFEACNAGEEQAALQRLADVESYLSRSGVRRCTKLYGTEVQHPGDALIRIASDEGNALIVAGAYGHSRLGEWIFGGATAELLGDCPVPCLLCH